MQFDHSAELEQEPERDAALVLRFERTADIPERPILFGEDIREATHEYDMQGSRLAGEDIRQDASEMRLSFDRLRHRTLLCRRIML